MPLELQRFAHARPYLYHLTARFNLRSIATSLELRCTNVLLEAAGFPHQRSIKRREHVELTNCGGPILIRDQKPLAEGAIAFEDGWDLARFVEHVNDHVFFWPGQSSGPVKPGLNHFNRYRHESPAILRFRTESVVDSALHFSRCNSGAPRCSAGKHSPRGSATYLPATEFVGTVSDVVEVVALGALALPAGTEVSDSPEGPWLALRSVLPD